MNPAGAPSIEELRASGADGARNVAFNNDQFFGYQRMLERQGMTTAVVLARESFPDGDYQSWAGWYAARCTPTYWILGNEPDAYILGVPSPSSWSMDPLQYADFWHQAALGICQVQLDAVLCVAGLVSGSVTWLEGVLPYLNPGPDAVDIHPYAKTTAEARGLLRAYRGVLT
jgi:hypothetical protein